jgi:hypothetical protein
MGRSDSTETTLLLVHKSPSAPGPKFPLRLAPPSVRPYLELIRLEKVNYFACSVNPFTNIAFIADWNNSYVLALWCVIRGNIFSAQ